MRPWAIVLLLILAFVSFVLKRDQAETKLIDCCMSCFARRFAGGQSTVCRLLSIARLPFQRLQSGGRRHFKGDSAFFFLFSFSYFPFVTLRLHQRCQLIAVFRRRLHATKKNPKKPGLSAHVHRLGLHGTLPHRVRRLVPLAALCQEKLPQRDVPQLEARLQRGPNDVRHRHRT